MIKDTSIRLSQQVKYKQLPFVYTSVAWFDLGVWSEAVSYTHLTLPTNREV